MSVSDVVPGVAPATPGTDAGACEHFVQFQEDESVPLAAVQGCRPCISIGGAAVLIATLDHHLTRL